ncbi:hypothetical protein WN48_07322 [Eufriesea mexicana]|uniref:Uncharacterized protein n=1 Tax=Eufriesea mexicana TaxID=516756 RepID=A0A310SUL4_9HYME|nr:hypothetical protein WN48_07322 [Eufriesea mexicana]
MTACKDCMDKIFMTESSASNEPKSRNASECLKYLAHRWRGRMRNEWSTKRACLAGWCFTWYQYEGLSALVVLGTFACTTGVWALQSDIAYRTCGQTPWDDSLIGFSPMWQGNGVTGCKASLGTLGLSLGVSSVRSATLEDV